MHWRLFVLAGALDAEHSLGGADSVRAVGSTDGSALFVVVAGCDIGRLSEGHQNRKKEDYF